MASRTVLKKVHDHFALDSKEKLTIHKQKLTSIKGKNSGQSEVKPPFRVAFIPGNCTNSKLIQHLSDNSDSCPSILIESEIDTLANANKSDFGGFSDLLRKAFHNEPISYTRKLNDEFLEVDKPNLSIVLSGTPNQIHRLIGTPEDGLFSRFMFFCFKGKTEWEDVSPSLNSVNIEDLLNSMRDDYFKLWKFYSKRDVSFDLTERQWQDLNQTFKEELSDISKTGNPYSVGVIKRHGLIMFKICMVLTAMRMFDLNIQDKQIICEDKDFHIAKHLVLISLDSSLDILTQMPLDAKRFRLTPLKDTFLEKLSPIFMRAEAVEAGRKIQVSARTIDRWLGGYLKESKLIMEAHGRYQKVPAVG